MADAFSWPPLPRANRKYLNGFLAASFDNAAVSRRSERSGPAVHRPCHPPSRTRISDVFGPDLAPSAIQRTRFPGDERPLLRPLFFFRLPGTFSRVRYPRKPPLRARSRSVLGARPMIHAGAATRTWCLQPRLARRRQRPRRRECFAFPPASRAAGAPTVVVPGVRRLPPTRNEGFFFDMQEADGLLPRL